MVVAKARLEERQIFPHSKHIPGYDTPGYDNGYDYDYDSDAGGGGDGGGGRGGGGGGGGGRLLGGLAMGAAKFAGVVVGAIGDSTDGGDIDGDGAAGAAGAAAGAAGAGAGAAGADVPSMNFEVSERKRPCL